MSHPKPHLFAAVLLLAASLLGCGDDSKWKPIDRCIMGVEVDFQSGIVVTQASDAVSAFSQYLAYAEANQIQVFGAPASSWTDVSANIDGTYSGKRYWRIHALRDGVLQIVFDVSEDGDVVRLLGCI